MTYETSKGEVVSLTLLAAQAESLRTQSPVPVKLNGNRFTVYPDTELAHIVVEHYRIEREKDGPVVRPTAPRGILSPSTPPSPLIAIVILSIIALIVVLFMSSCSKTEVVEPRQQVVTYQAECTGCLVYIEDAKWNRNATTDRGKNQHFVVTGKFEYKFVNNGLDSVSMRIYTSALGPGTDVSARIFTNDGKSTEFSGRLGFPDSYFPGEDIEFEHTLELGL